MPATKWNPTGGGMMHAAAVTSEACDIFAGPHAAKRMARAIGCSIKACEAYLARRRRMSLDAAIELAARHPAAHALLNARIEAVKAQNADTRRANNAALVEHGHVAGRSAGHVERTPVRACGTGRDARASMAATGKGVRS